MNVDQNLKRYWPLIVCVMLGTAAYFQASAIGSLISANLGGEPYVPEGEGTVEAPPDDAETSDPILERNPFDSTTGALDDDDDDDELDDELDDSGVSECESGQVVLIAQNEDPKWAFASIKDSSGKAQLIRVGDAFGKYQLEELEWDRVYLTENGKRCYLAMGGSLPGGQAARSSDDDDDEDPEERIKRVSDYEFVMSRDTLEELLQARGGLLGKTQVTPMKKGDRVTGLQLGRIGGGSTLSSLGLKTGDVLQSMSGTQLTSPERLLAAYERMQEATIFNLRILRDGAPRQIKFRIR